MFDIGNDHHHFYKTFKLFYFAPGNSWVAPQILQLHFSVKIMTFLEKLK